jgi:hypothetical protein
MDKYGRKYSCDGFISLMRQRNDASELVGKLRRQSPAALVSELAAAEKRLAELQHEIDEETKPRG